MEQLIKFSLDSRSCILKLFISPFERRRATRLWLWNRRIELGLTFSNDRALLRWRFIITQFDILRVVCPTCAVYIDNILLAIFSRLYSNLLLTISFVQDCSFARAFDGWTSYSFRLFLRRRLLLIFRNRFKRLVRCEVGDLGKRWCICRRELFQLRVCCISCTVISGRTHVKFALQLMYFLLL